MAAKWADTPSGQDCVITEAFVNFETDPKTVTIYGLNFECENLIVTLGDYGPLDPLNVTCSPDPDNEITIELPSGIPDGDYLLSIQTGSSAHQYDAYNLTIDAPIITQEQLDDIIAGIKSLEDNFYTRFTDMGDGTIRDNDTGLLWLKNANCFSRLNWYEAMDAAALLADGQCGLTDGSTAGDWRLPTKAEWEAFYSTVYDNPALVKTIGDAQWSEGDAFTGVQSNVYWSSTEFDSIYAWYASMYYGYMSYANKGYSYYVWPVRSGND
ncbi:MAG: DUF1566 domain-containing protein [Desulfobacteraceae bacterium]|nr:DUF1566 domain-containing protein [Desulfobacteraceae bacterium]MBC2719080.1 DUF1566 domain-containing protein [Desulfobacteraceae bacterium]